jgi:hypothetical protein
MCEKDKNKKLEIAKLKDYSNISSKASSEKGA